MNPQKISFILISTLLVITIFSCKKEQQTESITTLSQEEIQKRISNLDLVVANFKACKAVAIERNDCRNSITKLISEFYNVSDFKIAEDDYIIYDSIQPIIKRSSKWETLGSANNQDVLNKAQDLANKGYATIAIDTTQTYGQVVMIIPGETTLSTSWNLKAPNTVTLTNYNAIKSFYNKSLAYAYKYPEKIKLFSKTK